MTSVRYTTLDGGKDDQSSCSPANNHADDADWKCRCGDGRAVSEMLVEPYDLLAGKTLAELWPSDGGNLILGNPRSKGKFHGTPRGDNTPRLGDSLIVYRHLEDVA